MALNPDDELRNLQVALLYSLSLTAPGRSAVPNGLLWEEEHGRESEGELVHHRRSGPCSRVGPQPADQGHAAPSLVAAGTGASTAHPGHPQPAGLGGPRHCGPVSSFGQVMVLVSVYQALLATPFADGAVIGSAPANDDAEAKAEEKPSRDRLAAGGPPRSQGLSDQRDGAAHRVLRGRAQGARGARRAPEGPHGCLRALQGRCPAASDARPP